MRFYITMAILSLFVVFLLILLCKIATYDPLKPEKKKHD